MPKGSIVNSLESHLVRQIEHSREFFWHRLRWRAVRFHLPSAGPFELLDVGAGAGMLGEYLRRDLPGGCYRFVEPIASLERHLETTYGVDSNLGECASYESIQYVTLLDVLEHQPDDRSFLNDLVEKMQPGATLIITVPAFMGLWSRWDVALGHFRRYEKRSLMRCFQGLPVDMVELTYLFPEMIPLGLVRRQLDRFRKSELNTDSAEFPDLPARLNDVIYALGVISLHLRRLWPAGTSLMAVLRRRQ